MRYMHSGANRTSHEADYAIRYEKEVHMSIHRSPYSALYSALYEGECEKWSAI